MERDEKLAASEASFKDEMKKLIDQYSKAEEFLRKEFDLLSKQQEKLPQKFSQHEDFEDFVILASECKHRSIRLLRHALAASGTLGADMDYVVGHLRLYIAEDFLKQHVDKVTDLLRNSYISSNKSVRALIVLQSKIDAFTEVSEKLVRAFEGDEVNCRKFMELRNKLKGL